MLDKAEVGAYAVVTLEEQEQTCLCCTKHVPKYHVLYEVDNTYLCPTTFSNMLQLEQAYKDYKGRPPGHIRKHFSDYVQNLVQFRHDRNN